MILVSVSHDQPPDFVLVTDEIRHIRNDDIYAVHIVARKCHAAIDQQHFVTVFENCNVFSDLIQSSQRNDLYRRFVSSVFSASSRISVSQIYLPLHVVTQRRRFRLRRRRILFPGSGGNHNLPQNSRRADILRRCAEIVRKL